METRYTTMAAYMETLYTTMAAYMETRYTTMVAYVIEDGDTTMTAEFEQAQK